MIKLPTLPTLPTMPEDEDLTSEHLAGFEMFRAGLASFDVRVSGDPDAHLGWSIMWTRYGQGVKASLLAEAETDVESNAPSVEPQNPYPQFHPAWEAWATGCNEETHL
jgi:hypothetical protein